MQEGKVAMSYKNFLGYCKGEDGRPKIVPEEAKIVKEIYQMFLSGTTIRNIARSLTARQILPQPEKRLGRSALYGVFVATRSTKETPCGKRLIRQIT